METFKGPHLTVLNMEIGNLTKKKLYLSVAASLDVFLSLSMLLVAKLLCAVACVFLE